MSELTLIRHGQARSFARETVLTPLGETQAARLAAFWLKHGIQFEEVRSGTLERQIGTEQAIARAFRNAGHPWPTAQRDRGWNEYDAAGVLGHSYQAARGGPEEDRAFQRMLRAAMSGWLAENPQAEGVELWPAFRDRVSAAIAGIMSGPPGRRVAVFTSGGPIGFAVNLAMQGPAKGFLDVNWRVRNCSVTGFLLDKNRLTLDSFNGIPHLDEDGLRSYL